MLRWVKTLKRRIETSRYGGRLITGVDLQPVKYGNTYAQLQDHMIACTHQIMSPDSTHAQQLKAAKFISHARSGNGTCCMHNITRCATIMNVWVAKECHNVYVDVNTTVPDVYNIGMY